MIVWVVNVGEPMATDPGAERKLRMGLLADTLAERGHDVVWWTSTFDHNYKRQRFNVDTQVPVNERLVLQFLHARSYSANISLNRLVNHYQLGRAFERMAEAAAADALPDVIFATMPIVELAAAAARFGHRRKIPVVIDVRDLHPDIYLTLVPKSARSVAKLALSRMYGELRTSVRLATGVVAIAPSFLRWALGHAGRERTDNDAVFPLAYPQINAEPAAIQQAEDELQKMGVRPDKKILWYVGTFNRWIDLQAPIDAARKLAKDGNDDFQLVISGSGDFEAEWRRLADDLPNVVFTGWIGVPHIIHLRSIAWAGIAPYRSGFHTVGNKLFEYMAGGLPIMLSIGGDAKAVIEQHECGVSYSGGDADSFLAALTTMSAEGAQARMAANGLRAYEENYASEKVYGDMVDYILDFAPNENRVG